MYSVKITNYSRNRYQIEVKTSFWKGWKILEEVFWNFESTMNRYPYLTTKTFNLFEAEWFIKNGLSTKKDYEFYQTNLKKEFDKKLEEYLKLTVHERINKIII